MIEQGPRMDFFPVEDIEYLEKTNKTAKPKFTIVEQNQFINIERANQELAARFFVKIRPCESVNNSEKNFQETNLDAPFPLPALHYFAKPYMVSNPNGDLIWSAIVEPCKELLIWFEKMGENIQVLGNWKSDLFD